jgi:hypothetical protein
VLAQVIAFTVQLVCGARGAGQGVAASRTTQAALDRSFTSRTRARTRLAAGLAHGRARLAALAAGCVAVLSNYPSR